MRRTEVSNWKSCRSFCKKFLKNEHLPTSDSSSENVLQELHLTTKNRVNHFPLCGERFGTRLF